MMKLLAIAVSGVGREVQGADGRSNLTNIQCKAIQNWHNELSSYNEYMLIKMKKRKK
jgi:hypothetical protein